MNLKNSDKYILLFENCFFTKGHQRSLLVDNQRNEFYFFDNHVFEIFSEKNKSLTIAEILKEYSDDEVEILIEYFLFMIDNELVFLCDKDELSFFPEMNRNYETPEFISNCIIDFNQEPIDLAPYAKAIIDLDKLGCENIEIRDFYGLSANFLNKFLKLFNKTIIYRIELVLKSIGSNEDYKKLMSDNPRITSVLIHSCDNDHIEDEDINLNSDQKITFIQNKILDDSHCGVVSPNYFNLDLRHTLESLSFNTCLNKKISIDVNGDIKNCPSMKTSYGNITEVSLIQVAKDSNFQKNWGIRKDQISICKICEFRNICTDCRAFHSDDYSFAKPKKCNYDPYLTKWEN